MSPAGDDRLLIFDCDGVLVDSEPLANRVLHTALEDLGLAMDPEETTARFKGLSLDSCVALIERMLARKVPESFLPDLERRTREAFGQSLQPVAGVAVLLEKLTTPFCVASSGSHVKIRHSLELTGLGHWFPEDAIFSADDVSRGKPAPDLFLFAARRLGFRPADCIVIEDSVPGVTAARRAGMRVFGYGERTSPRQLRAAGATVFTRMHELADLVSDLSAD